MAEALQGECLFTASGGCFRMRFLAGSSVLPTPGLIISPKKKSLIVQGPGLAWSTGNLSGLGGLLRAPSPRPQRAAHVCRAQAPGPERGTWAWHTGSECMVRAFCSFTEPCPLRASHGCLGESPGGEAGSVLRDQLLGHKAFGRGWLGVDLLVPSSGPLPLGPVACWEGGRRSAFRW